MHRLEPYSLWLGNIGDGRDVVRLLDTGIEAVVQLAAEESPLALPRELVGLRIPLLDGSGNSTAKLQLAVRCVADLVWGNVPTLVCCSMGLSRSPAIVAAALARVTGESPADCLTRIGASMGTDISPGLWQELLNAIP